MYETTYDLGQRGRPSTRTWVLFIVALAAFLVMIGLVAVACGVRSDAGADAAGTGAAGIGTPTPTATPASSDAPGPDTPQDSGHDGGHDGGNGGGDPGQPDPGGESPDDPDDPEEPLFPVFPVALPTAAASVAPETVFTNDCQGSTNVTVAGTVSVQNGLPAFYPVTVQYRWVLNGVAGLPHALHFPEAGEKGVTTTVAVTGSAQVAIEILDPNGHTSDAAPVQLACV